MSTEAMKLALEALEDISQMQNHSNSGDSSDVDKSITSLRQAIAEAEKQEPVAVCEPWLLESTQEVAKHMAKKFYPEVTQWRVLNDLAGVISQIDNMTTGLIREPQQPNRGPLTDEQIYDMYNEPRSDAEMLAFARAIEAAHGIKD